jgi:hypothetical protein
MTKVPYNPSNVGMNLTSAAEPSSSSRRRAALTSISRRRAVHQGTQSARLQKTASGQSRSFDDIRAMSGLPPQADLRASLPLVAFVPIPDSCAATKNTLFDDFVGLREQCGWNVETERPCGL